MQNTFQSITLALPKGRILKEALPILKAAGIEPEPEFFDPATRKLQFASNHDDINIILIRSFDVATFVAFGGATMGIAGNDVIAECGYDSLYAPVDLGIGACRLSLAAKQDAPSLTSASHVRVASKYPNLTAKFFAAKGIQAESIKLNGAMELAPLTGLAPYIVDLVSTGNTLKANGLAEVETMLEVTSKLVVNRLAYKTNRARLDTIINSIRSAI